MNIQYEMNKPQVVKIGRSDAVLACRQKNNWWLKRAIEYLPEEVFEQNAKGFLFTSTAFRDACRLSKHYCQTREIILISERILPGKKITSVADSRARYFIYVVLHEMAHAIKEHKSPFLDNLTGRECEAQEKEADDLAVKWFNDHVIKLGNLPPITREEIKAAQEEQQKLMKKIMDGI